MNAMVPILDVKAWDFLFPTHRWGQLAAGKAALLQRTWLPMGESSRFTAEGRAVFSLEH